MKSFRPFRRECERAARGAFRRALVGATAAWLAVVATAFEIASAPAGQIEAGAPPFVMFNIESVGLQSPPLDLKQLADGRILVVGASELCVGDGFRWERIPRSERETTLLTGQVAVGNDGRIHVSETQGFCRVEFDERGGWYLVRSEYPENQAPMHSYTSNVRAGDRWIWFDNGVVEWDLRSDQAPRSLDRNATAGHAFLLDGAVFIPDSNRGSLHAVAPSGERRVVIAAEDSSPGMSIISSAPLADGRMLVGTSSSGVWVFDGQGLSPLASGGVLGAGNRINDLVRTMNDLFVASVDGYGLVFFDSTGRVLQTLDRRSDNRLAHLRKLLWTAEGMLWGYSRKGIVRVNFPSRVSLFENAVTASMDYVNPVRFEGRLWLLATGSVLRGEYDGEGRLAGFEKVETPAPFVYSLGVAAGRLLAGCDNGLWEWRGGVWRLLAGGLVNPRVAVPSGVPDRWLYAARNEVGWIDFEGDEVALTRFPHEGLGEVYNAIPDRDWVWLELGAGRIGRMAIDGRQHVLELFNEDDGVTSGWVELFILDDRIRVQCSGRTLIYNELTRRFENDETLAANFPELTYANGGRAAFDARGRLWVPDTDRVRIHDRSLPEGDQRRLEFLPSDLKPTSFICEPGGVVWLQGQLCFARYDPGIPLPPARRLRALVSRVELPGSGRTLLAPGVQLGRLVHTDNSMIAHFAAIGAPVGESVTFEIMMEGLGAEWVSTGVTGAAGFNHLDPGVYTLRVRPRAGASVGEETAVSLVVLPPWYRTTGAYVAYGLFMVTVVAGAIWLPLYAERRRKEKLARLVDERTVELRASEERYRVLNAELERRVEARTVELDHAAAQLSAANRELESFAYSISHDLKAPLRNIMGFTELLERRLGPLQDHDCSRFMEVIVSETRRLSTLIGELLRFSRIGKAEMAFESVDLGALIDAVRREIAGDLEGRQIEWRVGPLPLVEGDRVLLRQVVANLVGNAVKFTRNRPCAVIEITSSKIPDACGFATFVVRDNGAGFNPKYGDKLFGVFQRLHSEKAFEGTGIGLANVKRIVGRHGGEVWAEGEPDRGAAFFFTLKLASAA